MSASHIAANRNSTPEGSSSLRPPVNRTSLGAGHHLRASADMGGFSSPLANRGIRPASEIYFGRQNTQSGNPDEMERAAQQWLADIDQYENTLEEMATATLDQDFKDELSAIEQWFRVLSEAERTAALYALLQQTTQVQIRFFIQVLQQMSKSLPMSGVLSPANFGEKDPMTQKLSDAMSKLSTGENRHSMMGRPPPSPGAGKRASGLDPSTIHRMFPDAAAAIAKQKSEFTEVVGVPPASNRNSTVIGDRSSMLAPTISAPDGDKENAPASPWNDGQSAQRPKSSGQQQPQQNQPTMGQFTAPPPSAGLRSPRLPLQQDATSVQTTTLNALEANSAGMPLLSPAYAGGSWASQLSTPMVANFGQQANQADMVANATAMKLAALSTVNNRIQLDDVRKYRRARSTDGHGAGNAPLSPGFPPMGNNILMTNELGQVLTPQQAAALQAQQLAAMNGRRSRPASPGIAMQGGMGGMANFASPQANGFLSADYANAGLMSNGMGALNLSQFGLGGGFDNHNSGFLGDEINRGRSPRGRRGSSKPPEDPTDPTLLQDIPNWLRSLRLHKYTDNLKDLKWQELVELDDAGLEARGVNALGARRKMLKVFEQVQEAKQDGKLR
ncbi:Flap-structured DNA-binding and RNA-binding protein [Didymella glomerata]|uniref:RNA-binding protein VTS1 n=1 Tax=Didymella glomerata TaxID=749621 RepID=A0A9W8WUW2_9PLEO|nr:Flap-structured DNA-binding and RNA-binding protein [Didymella glomerata]